MTVDRRTFLKTSGALAAASALPLALAAKPAAKPLRILILGGTGFLGPSTIEVALARGHKVSMFNRGRTRPELFPEVEKLHGDRDPKKGEGLKALEQGEWDVVIDNSGYFPRMVKASAGLVAQRCRQYLYISSISAYKEPNPLNGVETAPLATMPDPTAETMGPNYAWYGALKALCEQAAEAAMPGRATIVRPGYIVGPDDPTGRFTYWPVRFAQGGEVPVPGSPEDPVQVIDVRDLGAWLVMLAEKNITGAFHATGAEKPHRWGRIIEACQKAAGVPSTPLWLPTDFVAQQEGLAYPIWAPPTGETAGFHRWNVAKAMKAGLRFRPVEQTVADTLAWYRTQEKVEKGRTRLAAPTPEAEAKAVAAWKAQAKKG